MASRSSIARKARAKAEADFATWLMMAKLGGFDELPSNAQKFLTDYRARLQTMSEADSTALAVREVYAAYYGEMGGEGDPPEPPARQSVNGRNATVQSAAPSRQPRSATQNLSGLRLGKTLRAVLIFAGMVALIVTYRLLAH
jgi:hypothetical protein